MISLNRKHTLIFCITVGFALIIAFMLLANISTSDSVDAYTETKVQLFVNVAGEDIDEYSNYYIEWTNTSVEYSGVSHKPTAILKKDGDDEFERVLIVTCSDDMVNAGTYDVSIPAQNGDYTFEEDILTQFTINPKTVTVDWDINEYVYNGKQQGPMASYIDVNDNIIPLNDVTGCGINAGLHTAEVEEDAAGENYKLDNISKEYEILQAERAIKWETKTYTYNEQAQGPTAWFEDVLGNHIQLDVVDKGIDAGGHTAMVSESAAGNNYKLTDNKHSYSIGKATIEIVWSDTTSFTYDGQAHVPTASYMVSNKIIPLVVKNSGVNAGDYVASIDTSYIDTENYKIKDEQLTCAYSIAKKDVNVQWEISDNLIENYNAQGPIAYFIGLNNEKIMLNVSGLETAAGEYTATVENQISNYNLQGNLTYAYTILPKPIVKKPLLGALGIVFLVLYILVFLGSVLCAIILYSIKSKQLNESESKETDDLHVDPETLEIQHLKNILRELGVQEIEESNGIGYLNCTISQTIQNIKNKMGKLQDANKRLKEVQLEKEEIEKQYNYLYAVALHCEDDSEKSKRLMNEIKGFRVSFAVINAIENVLREIDNYTNYEGLKGQVNRVVHILDDYKTTKEGR